MNININKLLCLLLHCIDLQPQLDFSHCFSALPCPAFTFAFNSPNLVLPHLVMVSSSCLIALSCLVLSCLVFYRLVFYRLVIGCLVSCVVLSWLPCLVLSWLLSVPCLDLSFLVLVLSCFVLSWLPCLVLYCLDHHVSSFLDCLVSSRLALITLSCLVSSPLVLSYLISSSLPCLLWSCLIWPRLPCLALLCFVMLWQERQSKVLQGNQDKLCLVLIVLQYLTLSFLSRWRELPLFLSSCPPSLSIFYPMGGTLKLVFCLIWI